MLKRADVAGLIDAAGARSTLLMAHDWGAIIAWYFAMRRLRPLEKLVILNLPHPGAAAKAFRSWKQLRRSCYAIFFQIPWERTGHFYFGATRMPADLHYPRGVRRRVARNCLFSFLVFCLGCATPISVHRLDMRAVYRINTESVLTSERPSVASRQVLLRLGIFERFQREPEQVLIELHARTLAEMSADHLFALAEYSELHAERTRNPSYHVAAALYAYAFLFPDDGARLPDRLDPRTRTAASLYNRCLANALIGTGGAAHFDQLALPPHVGRLALSFDEAQLHWAQRRLTDFVPASNLEVRGLRNRYRRAGIGAAFAPLPVAEPGAELQAKNLLIADRMRIPVSLFLRFEAPRAGLREGTQRASMEIYNARETDEITVGRRRVPAELETSVALALSLDGASVWDSEVAGFRNPNAVPEGGLLQMWGPHQQGRVPVVFIHGTASSVARWAEMINELDSDPAIREHYEFWFFTYPTGVPILYSAKLLRGWLRLAVAELDPEGHDDALWRMLLVGHSQGGLLAKMQVISSGTRFWDNTSEVPFDQVELRPETRELVRDALFFEPLPFVSRVIFIATPQQGSFVAASWLGRFAISLTQAPGRLAGLPLDLARAGIALPGAAVELVQGDLDELRVQRALSRLPTSVDNMNPASSFIRTLADLPVKPPVRAHSIIPVTGDAPPYGQNDGVVTFESASIEEASSELVVFRSGHSAQSHPEAIQEVRRILLEQLAETP